MQHFFHHRWPDSSYARSYTASSAPELLRRSWLWIADIIVITALSFIPGCLFAQVTFTAGPGLTQSQNFNSIGSAATAMLPSGWRISRNNTFAAASTNTEQSAGTSGAGILTGTSTGALYNFANGVNGTSTDRAPGFLGSGGMTGGNPQYLYVQLVNNTGTGITELTANYTIEKYRSGAREWTIRLDYSMDGTTWTNVPAATVAYPADANNTTISNPPLDNLQSITITSLAVPNTATFYLRWSYTGTGGSTNGQGLGIDDVTLTAVTGPLLPSAVYSTTVFPEAMANNGTITATADITLTNAQFLNALPAMSTFTAGTHFTTANVPPGLTLTVQKISNTVARVSFTGAATNHAATNSVGNINLTFLNAAIEGGTPAASTISGLNRTDLAINFNDPAPSGPITRIRTVQGTRHISPLNGTSVTNLAGIVTGLRTNGFFMQDPTDDGDPRTSEGIYVFTGGAPTVAVGDSVHVNGTVDEFRTANPEGLTRTNITGPTITIQPPPTMTVQPTIIGAGGRIPPTEITDNDAVGGNPENPATLFDPDQDGLDFWESLEGMLVRVNNARIVGPTDGGIIRIVADNGAGATGLTTRGGIAITNSDLNPERIAVSTGITSVTGMPMLQVGDRMNGQMTGVVDYDQSIYRIRLSQPLPPIIPANNPREVTSLVGVSNLLSVGTYNLYNLNPTSPNMAGIADDIVNRLRSPDILGVQEIQDNNGTAGGGVVDADVTLNALITAIQTAGGPLYQYRQINPVNGQDGGAPGGNIRVVILFNPSRVQAIDRGTPGSLTPAVVSLVGSQAQITPSPGRIDPTNVAWANTRKPLAAEFQFGISKLFFINAHLSSKIGDNPDFGRNQPPIRTTEAKRNDQAAIIQNFVQQILAAQPNANVVVVGDMNEHEFRQPIQTMKGTGTLINLIDNVPLNDRYTYNFQGNSQVLDNILISPNMLSTAPAVDIVHLNADYDDSKHTPRSDHDAVVALFYMPTPAPPVTTGPTPPPTTPTARIDGFTPQFGLSSTEVTIFGFGFTGTTAVTFGGVPAASFRVINDNQIVAVVGAGASGAIVVTTPLGTASAVGFFFGPNPPAPPAPPISLLDVTPSTAGFGQEVLITGENLLGVEAVFFGDVAAQSFRVLDNNRILAVVGGGSSGTIRVIARIGTATLQNRFVYTPLPAPQIFAVNPSPIQASGDDGMVNLTGQNFQSNGVVLLSSTTSTALLRGTITRVSTDGRSLDFVIPAAARVPSQTTIIYLSPDQQSTQAVVRVLPMVAPTLSSITVVTSPSLVAALQPSSTTASRQAFTVQLNGSNFFRTSTVATSGWSWRGMEERGKRWENISLAVTRFASSTQLTVEIPAPINDDGGTLTISLTNLDGQSTNATFRIMRRPAPLILEATTNTLITANLGTMPGTSNLTPTQVNFLLLIRGKHFRQPQVSLSGDVLVVRSWSDSLITAEVSEQTARNINSAARLPVLFVVNTDDGQLTGVRPSLHFLFPQRTPSAMSASWSNDDSEETTLPLLSNRTASALVHSAQLHAAPNPTFGVLTLSTWIDDAQAVFQEHRSERYGEQHDEQRATLIITAIDGTTILQQSMAITKGLWQYTLDIKDLPSGSYIVQLVVGSQIRRVRLSKW
jgi:predicted extracellular nuclease